MHVVINSLYQPTISQLGLKCIGQTEIIQTYEKNIVKLLIKTKISMNKIYHIQLTRNIPHELNFYTFIIEKNISNLQINFKFLKLFRSVFVREHREISNFSSYKRESYFLIIKLLNLINIFLISLLLQRFF